MKSLSVIILGIALLATGAGMSNEYLPQFSTGNGAADPSGTSDLRDLDPLVTMSDPEDADRDSGLISLTSLTTAPQRPAPGNTGTSGEATPARRLQTQFGGLSTKNTRMKNLEIERAIADTAITFDWPGETRLPDTLRELVELAVVQQGTAINVVFDHVELEE
ncbi:MAG: hypothetical protein KDA96_05710 [Planctomycetaceae bacterium]|nr:hypothetical protein [Planctomycetaceae bacterium]